MSELVKDLSRQIETLEFDLERLTTENARLTQELEEERRQRGLWRDKIMETLSLVRTGLKPDSYSTEESWMIHKLNLIAGELCILERDMRPLPQLPKDGE